MIVQSHDGFVYLLPAIPAVWREGKISGVCLRGGFVIDELSWRDGKILTRKIRSTLGGNLRIRTAFPVKGLRKAKGENPNPLFSVPVTMETRNNSKVPLNSLAIPSSFTYDIPTKAGQTVNIKN